MSANYLKHLLDVRNGGQCRVRHTFVCFHPLQPKILCINDSPQEWLRAVDGKTGADEEPLRKRLFFLKVDELVLAEDAVAALGLLLLSKAEALCPSVQLCMLLGIAWTI